MKNPQAENCRWKDWWANEVEAELDRENRKQLNR